MESPSRIPHAARRTPNSWCVMTINAAVASARAADDNGTRWAEVEMLCQPSLRASTVVKALGSVRRREKGPVAT